MKTGLYPWSWGIQCILSVYIYIFPYTCNDMRINRYYVVHSMLKAWFFKGASIRVSLRSRCQRSLEALQELCRSPFQERALCHLAAFLIGKKGRRCTSSLQVLRQNLYLFNGKYRFFYGGLTFQSDWRSCIWDV